MPTKVTLLTVLTIFALIGVLLYIMPFNLFLVSLGISTSMGLYLLFFTYFVKPSREASSYPHPSLFFVISFSLPVIFIVITAILGTFTIITTILLSSLTLVIFYYTFMLPLAVFHKKTKDEMEATEPLPKISIIVPAHNEEGYIGKCIESVLENDYPADKREVIVVDDGSSDGTYEEARTYESRNIKVFHKKQGGKYSALNYAYNFISGEIVITIDADSLLGRTSLRRVVGIFQNNDEVAAVAGNIKLTNKGKFITNCQSLEYSLGINIFRRAMAFFGSVVVVPGALGAFRREVIESTGFFDPDTLTEDFDMTVKTLKLKSVVQSSGKAISFTEAPETWYDLYKQRLRWNRGSFMTLFKHRDALSNTRFGFLHKLGFPLVLFSKFFGPLARFAIIISIIASLAFGPALETLIIIAVFLLIQSLISLIALKIDDGDVNLVLYSPFLIMGYRTFIDIVTIKSLFDVLFSEALEWTSPKRVEQ
ncbi:MAG: glycosyltransferase [Candidatus Bipolaricaulota bacterium]|nr:glycosyltransferase family 2 protein [Candidatus Bipolaricaulota bacterium]